MAGVVSDGECREARQFAEELKHELLSWLKSEHSALLSP